jgi:hypothetical protein
VERREVDGSSGCARFRRINLIPMITPKPTATRVAQGSGVGDPIPGNRTRPLTLTMIGKISMKSPAWIGPYHQPLTRSPALVTS